VYDIGWEGVPENDAEAVKWYRLLSRCAPPEMPIVNGFDLA